MTTDLSGRELDEALARAMPDWQVRVQEGRSYDTGATWPVLMVHTPAQPESGDYSWIECPDYHASFDASFGDLWPECQRRGATSFTMDGPHPDAVFVVCLWGSERINLMDGVIGTTPQEAFARACYQVLQEVRE